MLTSLRGAFARRYKRIELQLYAYEARRDPEVQAWIAQTRSEGIRVEDVPSVAETFRAIVGDGPRSSAP